MTVRAAKFDDVPEAARLYAEAHALSIYAHNSTLDILQAKQMLVRAMHRHGHQNAGGSLFLVSEVAGGVRGFMLGILDHVYPCVSALRATDLLFIADDAPARDARKMVTELIAWAESNPRVVEVNLGVTNAIADWRRTGRFYERLGLEQCGAMYRREFVREHKEAAPCRAS